MGVGGRRGAVGEREAVARKACAEPEKACSGVFSSLFSHEGQLDSVE